MTTSRSKTCQPARTSAGPPRHPTNTQHPKANMRIFFDIETAPQNDPATVDYIRSTLRPPAQMKLQTTIEKWWRDDAPIALDTALQRAGLAPETGQVISISASGDEPHQVFAHCRKPDESEAGLIAEFFSAVEGWQFDEAAKLPPCASAWPADPVYPIGHNAGEFDLPYLWKRCRVLRVPTPDWLPAPGTRPGKYFNDTMTTWSGPGGRVSLDRLCTLLGVPSPKSSMSGADVGPAWLAGRYAEIQEYNLRDVVATAAVWHRLQGASA